MGINNTASSSEHNKMVRLIFLAFLFALSNGLSVGGGNYGLPKEKYSDEMLENIKIGIPEVRADLDDIHFYLHTRDGDVGGEELFLTEESISGSHYDASRDKTIILTHGFGADTDSHWTTKSTKLFLELLDTNIILVDWRKLAEAPWYFSAVGNVPIVANQTSYLINLLANVAGLQSERIMMIGHSLGAHVSGDTGMFCQQTHGLTMGNIIGIDPAGPEFHTDDINVRLDASDADFVVAIHVNGGDLLEGCIAYYDPCGHVDFYPNGGKHQPGCTDLGGLWDLVIGGCSHHKSHDYVYEGILHDQAFMSWQCSDWENFTAGACAENKHMPMGYYTEIGDSGGKYFLETNEDKP